MRKLVPCPLSGSYPGPVRFPVPGYLSGSYPVPELVPVLLSSYYPVHIRALNPVPYPVSGTLTGSLSLSGYYPGPGS